MALGVSPDGTSDCNAKLGIGCDMAIGLDDVPGVCKRVGLILAWDGLSV